MKNTILSLLRDKKTTTEAFRRAANHLGSFMAFEVAEILEKVEHTIETPLTKTKGYQIKNKIILVPILRAGIAMLDPFMQLFPASPVGFVGLKRDEETALPHLYYENLPKIESNDIVVILDPMIATGGSGGAVVDLLKAKGVKEENIIYAGMIAAPEGIAALKKLAPSMRVLCAEVDECLNDKKFIMPGLGDFGDRYFGTV
jgi:uracil phosphoribosyltransferase